ncbi:MAG TPA: hypothetical protein VIP11_19470 [Gemmatimonadaceae bacterium]
MWFKHRAWIPIAWLLSLVNFGAVWFAARPGEPWHATIHAALAVLFGLGAQRLALRHKTTAAGAEAVGKLRDLETRLASQNQGQVAQALDAIAIEVERIGEGQRFLTKLIAARDGQGRSAEAVGVSPPKEADHSSTLPQG